MAWTITIGEGDDAVVINEAARFGITPKKNVNSNGDVESVDWVVLVEGTALGSPGVIAARILALMDMVSEEFNGVNVLIEKDGETWKEFIPSEGFNGPHVIDFETTGEEEGGAGESLWRYRFTIAFKAKGLQDDEDENIYELQTSISETRKNGKLIRKVWKASAKSTSSAAALDAVLAFQPSEKYITHEQEEFHKDARATSVWIWELEAGGIKSHDCKVTYGPGGRRGWVEVPQAGLGSDPVLVPKQRGALPIEVVGTIVSFEPGIVPPAEHFSESDTLVRDTESERPQEPEIYDRQKGEYVLHYHEVWKSFGPLPGFANHADAHNLIPAAQGPGDGRAGS